MKKTLTIPLTETKLDKRRHDESLAELLEQATAILNPNGYTNTCFSARWIARRAIRAVCEEIIRNERVWLPMEVSFTALWSKRAKGFRFQASLN